MYTSDGRAANRCPVVLKLHHREHHSLRASSSSFGCLYRIKSSKRSCLNLDQWLLLNTAAVAFLRLVRIRLSIIFPQFVIFILWWCQATAISGLRSRMRRILCVKLGSDYANEYGIKRVELAISAFGEVCAWKDGRRCRRSIHQDETQIQALPMLYDQNGWAFQHAFATSVTLQVSINRAHARIHRTTQLGLVIYFVHNL